MSTCLLKRGLPFLLTFSIGAGASALLHPLKFVKYEIGNRATSSLIFENRIYCPSDVDVRAHIISKPEATYTDEARRNGVTGNVVLSAVLTSTGDVEAIRVRKGLPDGLTEQAVGAARHIQFTPAMKSGKAVSQFAWIEYNFDL